MLAQNDDNCGNSAKTSRRQNNTTVMGGTGGDNTLHLEVTERKAVGQETPVGTLPREHEFQVTALKLHNDSATDSLEPSAGGLSKSRAKGHSRKRWNDVNLASSGNVVSPQHLTTGAPVKSCKTQTLTGIENLDPCEPSIFSPLYSSFSVPPRKPRPLLDLGCHVGTTASTTSSTNCVDHDPNNQVDNIHESKSQAWDFESSYKSTTPLATIPLEATTFNISSQTSSGRDSLLLHADRLGTDLTKFERIQLLKSAVRTITNARAFLQDIDTGPSLPPYTI